jgi:hemerythrin
LNLDLMAGKAIGQQTILRMVRGWIVDHVLQYDSRIRQYVSLSQEQ